MRPGQTDQDGTGGSTWTLHSMDAPSRRPRQQSYPPPWSQQAGHMQTHTLVMTNLKSPTGRINDFIQVK